MTEMQELRNRIEAAWDNRELLKDNVTKNAILSLIESLSDQIDAQVVFKNEGGACVSLVFSV